MPDKKGKKIEDDLSLVADISSKPKNIFRKKKHLDGEFIFMDKKIIENKEMSLEAKALLYYLLSKPPKWVVRITDIRRLDFPAFTRHFLASKNSLLQT